MKNWESKSSTFRQEMNSITHGYKFLTVVLLEYWRRTRSSWQICPNSFSQFDHFIFGNEGFPVSVTFWKWKWLIVLWRFLLMIHRTGVLETCRVNPMSGRGDRGNCNHYFENHRSCSRIHGFFLQTISVAPVLRTTKSLNMIIRGVVGMDSANPINFQRWVLRLMILEFFLKFNIKGH